MPLPGPVRFHGKHGFVNAEGERVIDPIFEELGDMREGLASLPAGGKLGFINERGEVVIEPRFDIPRDGCHSCGFSEGLAVDGLLGLDFLQGTRLEVDFRASTVCLEC